MIAHLLAVLIPLIITAIAIWNYSFLSWHPICLSLAYGLFMSEGILLFSKRLSPIPNSPRSTKVDYHTYIHLAMLGIIFIGQTVVYVSKEQRGKAHFSTWHGILGLITVLLTTLEVLGGVVIKYKKIFKFIPKWIKTNLKYYHIVLGLIPIIFGWLTLTLGLFSNWFSRNAAYYVKGGCVLGVIILCAIVGSQAYEMAKRRLDKAAKKKKKLGDDFDADVEEHEQKQKHNRKERKHKHSDDD